MNVKHLLHHINDYTFLILNKYYFIYVKMNHNHILIWKKYVVDTKHLDFAPPDRWNSYAGRLNRRLYSGPRRQTRPTTNSRVIQRDSADQPSTKQD